jgi:hypothetical protein
MDVIYLMRVFNAIFRPGTLSKRVQCQHPNEQSALIELGRDKRFWCTDCGYVGFTGRNSSS